LFVPAGAYPELCVLDAVATPPLDCAATFTDVPLASNTVTGTDWLALAPRSSVTVRMTV